MFFLRKRCPLFFSLGPGGVSRRDTSTRYVSIDVSFCFYHLLYLFPSVNFLWLGEKEKCFFLTDTK